MMGSTSDTSGEVKTAISAKYLAQALKACGSMVELKASPSPSPMMFCVDGYQLVVMPIATEDTVRATKEAEGEAEAVAEQAEVETEAEAKPKHKRRSKEPVAV